MTLFSAGIAIDASF